MRVQGSRCRVQVLGLRLGVRGSEFRIQGPEFRVKGVGPIASKGVPDSRPKVLLYFERRDAV